MRKKDEETPALEIVLNENLPALSVDNLHVSARGDGFVLLRFLVHLPEGLTEQTRLVVHQENLTQMIDLLCLQMGHYPPKVKPKKKRSPKKS